MAESDRDQRTEQATPQRIRKALEEGQVGFSSELIGGLVVATGVLYFWFLGYWFFEVVGGTVRMRVTFFDPMILDPRTIVKAIQDDVSQVGMVILPLIIPLFIISLISGLMQTNFNISFKPLSLNWEKLSIPSGVKRIFSMRSLVRAAFSIAKAATICALIIMIARSQLDAIVLAVLGGTFKSTMFTMCDLLLYTSISIAATMAIIGVADLAFQKWKHAQDLMMSIQDIRDEHKESEGDPLMKARIKRLQSEMSRKRMLTNVPKASVVITNPTHYAVAVQYDRETMEAPIVVAKGKDHLAKKIIETAKANNVAVVERKPVARYLYFNIDVGKAIPYELYQVMAEILNYVNRLKQGI